jgi:hypothetical protein
LPRQGIYIAKLINPRQATHYTLRRTIMLSKISDIYCDSPPPSTAVLIAACPRANYLSDIRSSPVHGLDQAYLWTRTGLDWSVHWFLLDWTGLAIVNTRLGLARSSQSRPSQAKTKPVQSSRTGFGLARKISGLSNTGVDEPRNTIYPIGEHFR